MQWLSARRRSPRGHAHAAARFASCRSPSDRANGWPGVARESPLPPTGPPGGLAVHLLAGALIAPIAEELIFRGVAINAWRTALGPTAAIVRSSLLFAAAHVLFVGGDTFTGALAAAGVGFLGRVPIALFLGWAFVRRGTIWAPIGLHAAFNGILITAAEILVGSDVPVG